MARLRDIVIDCRRPAPLARFWASALDGYQVAPYDDEELARLRAMGIDDPEDDPSVLIEPASGNGPRLWCNSVPESKVTKNRVHLDLTCDDVETELPRLVELGASVVARHEAEGIIVLADPEGNEFCLIL